jgi:predicted nucleotidyltransferase
MSFVKFSGADARDAATRVAQRLALDERVRLIFLYGSAADPTRSEVRDLDLALSCAPRLPMSERLRVQADAGAVAAMRVDLIDLDEAGVVLFWEVAETTRCLFARDVITQLAAHSVIDEQLRARLKGLGGFPNVLVHGHLELDPDRVADHLTTAPADFSEFLRAIRAWLVNV